MNILTWILSAVIAIAIVGLFYQGGTLEVVTRLGSDFTLCLIVAGVSLPIRGLLSIVILIVRKIAAPTMDANGENHSAMSLPAGITFRRVENTNGSRYEIHKGINRDTALAFLREREIKEEKRYIIVETPDGNFGKDLAIIFNENNGETIEFGDRKPLPQLTKSPTHCARCGYMVLPAGQAPAGAAALIVLEDLQKNGIGFSCRKCRTLWCPFCISHISGSKPFCGICGNTVEIFRG